MSLLKLSAHNFTSEITADSPWMFAPGGTHTINLSADQGSAQITLKIDRDTATVLNAALQRINEREYPQRAYFDREHEEQAGATAWPKRFFWSESPQPGVYAESEVSLLGRQLVEGKIVRAFSPSFFADADFPRKINRGQHIKLTAGKRGSPENPARMIGLMFPACGTLTNDPAFRKILPLWARNAGAPSGTVNLNPYINMKLTPEVKAALQARKFELEQSLPTLRAAHAADDKNAAAAEAVEGAEAELDTTTTKLSAHDATVKTEEMEVELRAQRSKNADVAVADAIKRGAIAAKDTATQDVWKNKCVEDPTNITLLASMRGSPALDRGVLPSRIASGLQITREDSMVVLRAYSAQRDPKKKGELFAREISKRIADGETLPLQAANTMGTLVGEIVAQQALELLTVEEPVLHLFSTDFSSESAKMNQEVTTRIVGIPSASDYHVDNGYVSQNQIFTDVSVTISAHRFAQAEFGAEEIGGTGRKLFDEIAPALADCVGADAVAIALAEITAAQFTEAAIDEALIDFDRETVIRIGGALRDRGVRRNRFLLLNGSYYDKLFSDQAIVTLAGNQKAELITGDELVPVHGFNVARCPTLPATGNLTGFGGGKSSIIVAARVPADYANALPGATGGGTSQIITNTKSGLSIHLVQFVNHQLGKAYMRMAYMLGANVGQQKAGQRLRSGA